MMLTRSLWPGTRPAATRWITLAHDPFGWTGSSSSRRRRNCPSSASQQRLFSSSPPPPPSHAAAATEERNNNSHNDCQKSNILYVAPMAGLVTRLKAISITSCFLSVVVLPSLVAIKNGDLPTAKQATMGGVALVGAVGSTAALHFVFGPYITELRYAEEDGRAVSVEMEQQEVEESTMTTTSVASTAAAAASSDGVEIAVASLPMSHPHVLLQATTRSVFGWKNTYTFDPWMDVTEYYGARPFANFAIQNGTVPLFIHTEKLDDETRHLLLGSMVLSSTKKEQDAAIDKEGLQQQQQSKQTRGIKDDDFF